MSISTPPFAPSDAAGREAVADFLAQRGLAGETALLGAFRRVPRAAFVPPELVARANEDRPLAIGFGQTISQPWIVARMLQALDIRPGDKVLDIGTGSGYQAALLAELGAHVWTVECVPQLAIAARERLARLGYPQVVVREGDGRLGWPQEAPFDAIVVAAQSENVPETLWAQLRQDGGRMAQLRQDGGRMVLPVGPPTLQDLRLVIRHGARQDTFSLGGCMFVPLV